MDSERFWELNTGLAPATAVEQLRNRLSALEPDEIESFQEHFDRAVASAYRWDLWAAAYLIGGGCSDDGFTDFRYGLVSRGRSVFDAAVADPDSLSGVADAGSIGNESFGYVARDIYKTKTKQELPNNDVVDPADPIGEQWDFDDEQLCQQKLPKLWGKGAMMPETNPYSPPNFKNGVAANEDAQFRLPKGALFVALTASLGVVFIWLTLFRLPYGSEGRPLVETMVAFGLGLFGLFVGIPVVHRAYSRSKNSRVRLICFALALLCLSPLPLTIAMVGVLENLHGFTFSD